MDSIFDKTRNLVLGNIHEFLNRARDRNSIVSVKQDLRDSEANLAELESSLAEQSGEIRTLTRDLKNLNEREKTEQETIDIVLGNTDPNDDHLAEDPQMRLDSLNVQIKDVQENLAAAQTLFSEFQRSFSVVKSRHEEGVRDLERLERLQRNVDAKQAAAKVLQRAGAIARSSSTTASVDNAARELQKNSDVADARLAQEMAKMGEATGSDEARVRARAAIEKRRAELAQAKPASASAA